jgi:polysaccharide pyruvyl transferase WcaK-like protein
MKVLVLWADNSSANLGVRVLAAGAQELALRAWGANATVEFQDFERGDSTVEFNRAGFLKDVGRPRGPIKKKLASYDVILDTGAGDSFTDIYGLGRTVLMAHAQNTALRFGKKLVFTPQTIGPFRTRVGRRIAKHIISRAELLLSRDPSSTEYSKKLGREPEFTASDLVFALPVPLVEKSRDVVLNVSGLLWRENTHVDADNYRRNIHELIDCLLALGRKVTLFAHVLHTVNPDNDVHAIEELRTEYGDRCDYEIPKSLASARETVASARVVVGSRMHACLNAISTGTPAVPWAYSRKFGPLFKDLGWEHGVDLRSDDAVVARTMKLIAQMTEGRYAESLRQTREEAMERFESVVRLLQDLAPQAGS